VSGPTQRFEARDPWAHRRGEPRVFAFLWTVYVMLAVGGSVLWASRFAALASSFGPAARVMLVVLAVGATVLWLMVRLSQASPARAAAAHVLTDCAIILTPVQLVLWPLAVLAGWPLGVVAAIAALMAAWTLLVGGVLAIALGGTRASAPGEMVLLARTAWMLVILALVGWAPLVMASLGSASTPAPVWLAPLSPLTAIPALTGKGISGPQVPVTQMEWRAIGGTAIAAGIAWVLAFVWSMLGRHRDRA